MQFRFKDNEDAFQYTMAVALSLQMYTEDWVLAGPYLVEQYDPELILDFINRLTPENLRYEVLSKNFEGNTTHIEPWYQTQYTLEKISDEKLKVTRNTWPICISCYLIFSY